MANISQNLVSTNLGTTTYVIPQAGQWFFEGKITLPTLTSAGIASSLVVTVNQNGSPVYVGAAGAEGFRVDLLCALNDSITIVLTSAAANDALLNVLKMTLALGQGI